MKKQPPSRVRQIEALSKKRDEAIAKLETVEFGTKAEVALRKALRDYNDLIDHLKREQLTTPVAPAKKRLPADTSFKSIF